MRLLAGAITGIATAAAVLVPSAAQAATPYTAFTINGAPDSYVLGSGSRVIDDTTGTITLAEYPGVSLYGSAYPGPWSFHIAPPAGSDDFIVGIRYETDRVGDGGLARLDVTAGSRSCNQSNGWLVVKELVRDPDSNAIVSFAASYGFWCDNAMGHNTGEFRYNSSIGYAGATVSPESLDYGRSEVSPGGPEKTVTVTAAGVEPTAFGEARLVGPQQRAFAIAADGCAGKTLTPGQTCTVTVRTNPPEPGWWYSSLLVPTGGGGGPNVPLTVEGIRGAVGTYYPVFPARLMDTRNGTGVRKGVIGRQGTVSLQVTGRGGVPSSDVSAVVLNVTATSPTYDSYLTIYPTGQPRPTASNLNYPKGWTGANSVTVPVGAGGKVDFYNNSGSVHVIADVVGFYAGSNNITSSVGLGNELVRTAPERILDTRYDGGGKLPGGWMTSIPVSYGELWDPHIRALAVNITAVNPGGYGYLTAWDGSDNLPNTSTLNFSPGATVPNMAIVPTQTCYESWCAGLPMIGVYNGSSAATHVLVDIVGFFEARPENTGLRFKPLKPTRIGDSRSGLGIPNALGAGVTSTVSTPSTVAGPWTAGLALNVTAVAPTATTYVTVWSADMGRPAISHLNPRAGQTVPNAVITGISSAGAFSVYNNSGTAHVLIDVAGTFEVPWGAGTAVAGAGVRRGTTVEIPRLPPNQPDNARSAM